MLQTREQDADEVEAVARPSGRAYAIAGGIGGFGAFVTFLLVLLDGHRTLLRKSAIAYDFYDVQAHSLLDLRWDVPRKSLYIEGFLVHGKVYEYFGPVPAILRMPIAVFTHSLDGKLGGVSMLLGFAVALVATTLLAWRVRPVVRGDAPVTRAEAIAVGAFVFVAGAGSVLVFLASRTFVFHEAELWGAAITILAFERVVAVTLDPTRRNVVLASVLAGLALLTRASVGLGPVVALGILGLAALWPQARRLAGLPEPVRRRIAIGLLVAAAIPVVAFAYVNYAKFGTPFSVPFEKQFLAHNSANHKEALAANNGTMFGIQFIPTVAWSYLRPTGIGFSSLLPWVAFPHEPSVIGDAVFAYRLPTASLTTTMPFLTVLGAIGLVAACRPRRNAGLSVLRAPILGAAVAAVTTLAFAYVAHRYLADFLPILVVLAVAGLHLFLRWVAGASTGARRAATAGLGVLLVLSVWWNVGLAVLYARVAEPGVTRGALTSFVDLQYRVHDAVPAGAPPRVEHDTVLPEKGEPGSVVVLGDCAALYFQQGAKWRVLERTPRGGSFPLRLRLPAAPTPAPLPLVAAEGTHPARVTATVLPGDRVVFALNGIYKAAPVHFDPTRQHDVDVVLDPNVQRMSITFDGRKLLSMSTPNKYYVHELPPLDHVSIGHNETRLGVARDYPGKIVVRPTSTSLCRRVADRG